MSFIINYPTGHTVSASDYSESMTADIYLRNKIEDAVLPCIYNGFNVSLVGGLNVLVSPGSARGQNITFEIQSLLYNEPLPTFVILNNSKTITCADNATGYIVLNVNIYNPTNLSQGPTTNADIYTVLPTTDSDIPPGSAVEAMYTTIRQTDVASVWPFTQIVLAKITTAGGNVTDIDITYNANASLTARSYDWSSVLPTIAPGIFGDMAYENSNAIDITNGLVDATIGSRTPKVGTFTQAYDDGSTPIASNQLVNKEYVDTHTFHTGMTMSFRGGLSDVPGGWIPETNGTIGNSASSATIRANDDVLALYTFYWTNYPAVFSTLSSASLGSAALDFAAGYTMNLSSFVNAVTVPYGTGYTEWDAPNDPLVTTLGQVVSDSTWVSLTADNNGSHNHDVMTTVVAGGSGNYYGSGRDPNSGFAGPAAVNFSGSGTPFSKMQPTIAEIKIVKL